MITAFVRYFITLILVFIVTAVPCGLISIDGKTGMVGAALIAYVIKNKVEAFLVDEKETSEWHKAMFEDEQYGERTLHRDIPPANIRIKNFDRKELKEYSARVDEIKQREALNAEKK